MGNQDWELLVPFVNQLGVDLKGFTLRLRKVDLVEHICLALAPYNGISLV